MGPSGAGGGCPDGGGEGRLCFPNLRPRDRWQPLGEAGCGCFRAAEKEAPRLPGCTNPVWFSEGDSSHNQPLRPETLLPHSGGLRHVGGGSRGVGCVEEGEPATAQ